MSGADDFEVFPERLEGKRRIRQLRYALNSAMTCWPAISQLQTIYATVDQKDVAEAMAEIRVKLAEVIMANERAIADELLRMKTLAWNKASRTRARVYACARAHAGLPPFDQSGQYQAGD